MRGRRWWPWALLWLCLPGWVAADPGAPLYERARRTYRELIAEPPEARQPDAWRAAAQQFRASAGAATEPERGDDAWYMAGLCAERALALSGATADAEAALEAYGQLADGYRNSNLADDALLRTGRLLEVRGDRGGAEQSYRRLLADHGDGDMAEVARQRLARLGQRVAVHSVRHWSGTNYTRVVIDLSGAAPFLSRSLDADAAAGKPQRIYVDLTGAALDAACAPCVVVADGLLVQVRAAQHDADTVRVVLDLDSPARSRVFPLAAPARLVVDVFRAAPEEDVVGSLIAARAPPTQRPRLRIVIDPGHGGKDPGAVGRRGLREKDITLAIARELAATLPSRVPCVVKLTREQDRFLELEERTAIANAFEADLFISVHANASPSRSARGVETYYLERSSDRAVRSLAARENAGREEDLAEMEHILADVLLTSKIGDSRRLAGELQEALVGELSRAYGPTRDLGVKRGPFYVLTGAAMPAVLVETAFITHPDEGPRLAEPAFQAAAARALAQGVQRFVEGT